MSFKQYSSSDENGIFVSFFHVKSCTSKLTRQKYNFHRVDYIYFRKKVLIKHLKTWKSYLLSNCHRAPRSVLKEVVNLSVFILNLLFKELEKNMVNISHFEYTKISPRKKGTSVIPTFEHDI